MRSLSSQPRMGCHKRSLPQALLFASHVLYRNLNHNQEGTSIPDYSLLFRPVLEGRWILD